MHAYCYQTIMSNGNNLSSQIPISIATAASPEPNLVLLYVTENVEIPLLRAANYDQVILLVICSKSKAELGILLPPNNSRGI